jgi:tRNA uracil 4-sulfurtransferase
MEQVFLIRFNEIFLKSSGVAKNFLKILKKNIYYSLKSNGIKGYINTTNSRIYLSKFNIKDIFKIQDLLKNIFGIESFSLAYQLETINQEKIFDFVKQNYSQYILPNDSFKIKAKCINTPYHTKDIEIKLADIFDAKVDLTNPDKTIYIEARNKTTFIFNKIIYGFSGLPVGSAGKNLVLISGGIDSPLASFLTLKRGCYNIYLHFHSFPYVSKTSINKVKEILQIIKKYQNDIKLYLFPFAEIQNYIKVNTEAKYRIVLYRRSMMRIASILAKELQCKAITTGEALAQVSSQTLDNMSVINDALSVLTLRPLIGFNKNEIINLAKQIGTLDISNEPQEDTCTLFTPKHPNANTCLRDIKKIENKINIQELEFKLINKMETVNI